MFSSLDIALKKAGVRLCGECLHTLSFSKNCKHDNDSMTLSPFFDDDAIHGIPCLLTLVRVPSVGDMALPLGSFNGCLTTSFNVDLLEHVFIKPLRAVKSCALALLGCSSRLLMWF